MIVVLLDIIIGIFMAMIAFDIIDVVIVYIIQRRGGKVTVSYSNSHLPIVTCCKKHKVDKYCFLKNTCPETRHIWESKDMIGTSKESLLASCRYQRQLPLLDEEKHSEFIKGITNGIPL